MSKIKKISKKVEEVQIGEILVAYGETWRVVKNVFDPCGNTGNQKRHILYTERGGAFGRLLGETVTIRAC